MRGNMFFHWLLYLSGLQKARTQLSQAETDLLCRLARNKRCIVELGVFEGATSHSLREAMSDTGNLWCIDPFLKGALGISYGYSIALREVNRSKNGNVTFIRKFSYEAISKWQQPIDMIFIDADHSYESVRRDWEDWIPHIAQGGIVALHDSRIVKGRCSSTFGPVRLVNELKAFELKLKIIKEVDTITVFSRL